jgi:hypothetical protein
MPDRSIFTAFISVVFLAQLVVAQSPPSSSKTSQEEDIIRPTDEFKRACVGDGSLAAFGRLIDPSNNQGIKGAQVRLLRYDGFHSDSVTDEEGRYCIRYSAGPDIRSLRFDYRDKSCIENISGQRSNYINKLFGPSCSPMQSHASLFSPEEATDVYGAQVAKEFVPIQVQLINTSAQPVQLLSIRFEPENSVQSQSSDTIAPVDPGYVFTVASEHNEARSLLRFGPVGFFTLFSRVRSNTEALVFQTALRSNEIIPANYALTKTVFIAKSQLPTDLTRKPDTSKTLGRLVILANRLTITGGVESSISSIDGQASATKESSEIATSGAMFSIVAQVN